MHGAVRAYGQLCRRRLRDRLVKNKIAQAVKNRFVPIHFHALQYMRVCADYCVGACVDQGVCQVCLVSFWSRISLNAPVYIDKQIVTAAACRGYGS